MPSAEDRFANSELLNRMAYFYDENHLDDLAACFAPDAVMSMQIAGGDMVGPFEERDSIMMLSRSSNGPTMSPPAICMLITASGAKQAARSSR